MLKCENPKMAKRALAAFRASVSRKRGYSAWYEHGQLWILGINGDQYSVNDAEGPGSHNGFCFEQISEGDSDY